MEKTTITVSESTLHRFNETKEELDSEQNAPNHSADSFLNALLDTWDAVEDDHYQDEAKADILEDIRTQLNDIDGQQKTLDEKREIINRIDDLETEITIQLERLQ